MSSAGPFHRIIGTSHSAIAQSQSFCVNYVSIISQPCCLSNLRELAGAQRPKSEASQKPYAPDDHQCCFDPEGIGQHRAQQGGDKGGDVGKKAVGGHESGALVLGRDLKQGIGQKDIRARAEQPSHKSWNDQRLWRIG